MLNACDTRVTRIELVSQRVISCGHVRHKSHACVVTKTVLQMVVLICIGILLLNFNSYIHQIAVGNINAPIASSRVTYIVSIILSSFSRLPISTIGHDPINATYIRSIK